MNPSPSDPNAGPPTSIRIPGRYCGPPGAANGGWLAGTLAGLATDDSWPAPPVTVTLRRPTPVDVLIEVEFDAGGGAAQLRSDGAVVAEAAVAPPGWLDAVALPEPVELDAAVDAQTRFGGFDDHAFPHCFVCGTHREQGDGLRLFTGPVADRPGTVAGMVHLETLGLPPGGSVPTPLLWAALDCPTAWTHLGPGDALLLGRITGVVLRRLGAGPLVAVARATGADGRKRFATSILHDAAGDVVAAAEATWFAVAPTQ